MIIEADNLIDNHTLKIHIEKVVEIVEVEEVEKIVTNKIIIQGIDIRIHHIGKIVDIVQEDKMIIEVNNNKNK